MGNADNQAIFAAADTLWAIGKGKAPEVKPADVLPKLQTTLERVSDSKLKDLLLRASAQLYYQAEVERLTSDIVANQAKVKAAQASLAEIQKGMLADQQLKYLSSDIHEALRK